MISKCLSVFVLFGLVVILSKAERREVTESDLRRFLFHNYDKHVRPVKRMNDTIPVKVNLTPTGIRDVDIKDQQLKLDTYVSVYWEDQYLKWDPDYYGTETLILPASELWRPDISVYTGTPETFHLPLVTNAVIYYNGTVVWVPPLTVKNKCPEMKEKPKKGDIVQCTILIGSWSYHVGYLDIQEYYKEPLAHVEVNVNTNPKWKIQSMKGSSMQKKYACCKELYSEVKYELSLKMLKD